VREFYPTKLHACLAKHAPALEDRAKSRELSEEIYRERIRGIHFHYEGSLIRIARLPGWEPYDRLNATKRGRVGGFSTKARGRLMTLCAQIRRDALALFVTLTYPQAWPGDPHIWKRDLDAFGKWLRREFSGCSFIWKLEPQQRGAPHYHILVWGIAFLHHALLARRWFEIVGSNDPAHLAAGTRVEAVRSRHGVMRYASKLYMGKDFTLPPGWEHVGRFWGVIGRANLPLSKCETFFEKKETIVRFRRIVRRFMRSKGFQRRGTGSMRLFTEQHLQWARALDWAEGRPIVSLDFRLGEESTKALSHSL
jgi:hypothetical protein